MTTNQPVWLRPSRCDSATCVEVLYAGGQVRVRDSKLGEASPVLSFTTGEWAAFVEGVVAGEFGLGWLAERQPTVAAPSGCPHCAPGYNCEAVQGPAVAR